MLTFPKVQKQFQRELDGRPSRVNTTLLRPLVYLRTAPGFVDSREEIETMTSLKEEESVSVGSWLRSVAPTALTILKALCSGAQVHKITGGVQASS